MNSLNRLEVSPSSKLLYQALVPSVPKYLPFLSVENYRNSSKTIANKSCF